MQAPNRIHVGTSGWSYPHWMETFYPSDASRDRLLEIYAQQFLDVEVNTTFYRLVKEETLRHWYQETPHDFRFAVKASRYITHMKKLKSARETLKPFFERINLLGNKLGPVVFQLPPHWGFNPERLSEFLQTLDDIEPDCRFAFECRDHSWLNQTCYDLLIRHGCALCLYDLDGFQSPQILTADFAYVRLHGPDGSYQGRYSEPTLKAWSHTLRDWHAQGVQCYCFFDNDEAGYAPLNAARLKHLVTS